MTTNPHIPQAAEQRSVALALQGMLVDLLDLTLIGKHLHWNVKGHLFRSVHDELDELVDAWRILADDVAERAVTIGSSPDGQVEAIATATRFETLPAGNLSDREVLGAIGDRVADAAIRTRERVERLALTDVVSGDLLIHVAATLEKQLWMLRAQIPDSGPAEREPVGIRGGDSNGTDRS
ncbi:MAG: Dps family protein [Solirubrobacteraceae bacterium]